MMEETRIQEALEPEDGHPPDLPLGAKAGVFVGTATVAGIADLVGHWGITGLALGGFTAFALAKTSPQLYAELKRHFGFLPARSSQRSGERTIWEKLTNQYPEPHEARTERDVEEEDSYDDGADLHDGEEDELMEDLHPNPLKRGVISQEQETPAPLPSKLVFSSLLTRFTPTLDQLLLAVLPDGTQVFCAAKDLCHVALAGATGGGKSSIMRLLLSQLCRAGARVLLLNPHYTHYDLQADPPEDWTPFEPYLVYDPMECRKYEVIAHYLKQVAEVLLPQRLEKYAQSQPVGKPYFIALDELPAIVAHIKEAPDYLAKILREGRKVGIYLITAAQDFLVSTIAPGGGGAIRDCYRTAYYVGGDGTTAKTLLDKPARLLPENELGQGTVMLRSSRVQLVKQAILVRVPYVDNQALYRLLGPSTYMPARERGDELALEHLRPGRAEREEQTQAKGERTRSWSTGPRTLQSTVVRRMEREQRLRGRSAEEATGGHLPAREPEGHPVAVPPAQGPAPQPEVEITLHEAYRVWSNGNESVRDLAKALHITYYRANQLYQDMVKAGLLQKKPKMTVRPDRSSE